MLWASFKAVDVSVRNKRLMPCAGIEGSQQASCAFLQWPKNSYCMYMQGAAGVK